MTTYVANNRLGELFKRALTIRFPKGHFEYEIFFLDNDTFVRMQKPFVYIKGNSSLVDKLADFVYLYGSKNQNNWILTVENTMEKKVSYKSLNAKTETLLNWLQRINNLTPIFDFKDNAVFDRELIVNVEEMYVMVQSAKEEYYRITCEDNIMEFNDIQAELRSIFEDTQSKILDVARIYDKETTFSGDNKTLSICNQQFVFLVRKLHSGWKVSFFKKYDKNYIFRIHSLKEFQNDLCELTEKFAREERYVDLFR